MQSTVDLLGLEGATAILFAGVNSGRRSAIKRLEESHGDKRMALQILIELKREQNWASIEFTEISLANCYGHIKVKHCLCSKNESNACYFVRGFLKGFLSEVFERQINVSLIGQHKSDSFCELEFLPYVKDELATQPNNFFSP